MTKSIGASGCWPTEGLDPLKHIMAIYGQFEVEKKKDNTWPSHDLTVGCVPLMEFSAANLL